MKKIAKLTWGIFLFAGLTPAFADSNSNPGAIGLIYDYGYHGDIEARFNLNCTQATPETNCDYFTVVQKNYDKNGFDKEPTKIFSMKKKEFLDFSATVSQSVKDIKKEMICRQDRSSNALAYKALRYNVLFPPAIGVNSLYLEHLASEERMERALLADFLGAATSYANTGRVYNWSYSTNRENISLWIGYNAAQRLKQAFVKFSQQDVRACFEASKADQTSAAATPSQRSDATDLKEPTPSQTDTNPRMMGASMKLDASVRK